MEKIRIIDELYAHVVESRKDKAIVEYTAEVAHELRQPLTIIGGFARRIGKQLDSCNVGTQSGQTERYELLARKSEDSKASSTICWILHGERV